MEDLEYKVKIEVKEAEANLDSLSSKADEVKDHIDQIDDSVDQGTSSIGGLDKAFEQVFNTVAQEGRKGGKVLAGIFGSVKNMIPMVKTLNSTAIKGLQGIRGAIASTGIGAIVVALGLIISHWNDIISLTASAKRYQEEYTQAVENSEKQMDTLNWQHERQIRLLKAAGASRTELAELALRQAEEERKQVLIQYEYNQALVSGRKERKKLREEAEKDLKAADKKVEAARRELGIVKEEEAIRAAREKEEAKPSGRAAKELKAAEDPAKKLREELDKIKSDTQDVLDTMSKIARNVGGEWPKESVEYFSNLLKPETVRDDSEKVIEELKKAGVEINNAIISQLITGDVQKYNNELSELISERRVILATGNRTQSEDLQAELEIQKRAFEQEEDILNKRMEYIKKYSGKESAEYKDLESQLVVLGDERETFIREQSRKIAKAIYDEQLGAVDAALEVLQDTGDRWAGLNGGLVGKGMADIYKQQQEALQTYLAAMRDSYDIGTAEYERYAEEYERITERINGFDGKRTQFVFQQINEQYKYWNDLVSGVGSLFGSLASYYEEDIRGRRERNEIGEEEAEQEFERVKKLQLAEVWMNTLAGAIGAFLQASAAYPAPWGQILGAATAATVLASGVAQHTKIKNTKFGDTGGAGGSGGSAPNVGVTPIEVTDDIQARPSVLQDTQTAKDQRVFILESDIQESDKRVEIRETNTTF